VLRTGPRTPNVDLAWTFSGLIVAVGEKWRFRSKDGVFGNWTGAVHFGAVTFPKRHLSSTEQQAGRTPSE
jgi:hypothetical protein